MVMTVLLAFGLNESASPRGGIKPGKVIAQRENDSTVGVENAKIAGDENLAVRLDGNGIVDITVRVRVERISRSVGSVRAARYNCASGRRCW